MRTPSEANHMALLLQCLKLTIPCLNLHAESNHEAIDSQLIVLQYGLSEDQCWDRWPTHHQEQDQYNRERALEAVKWLWEEGEDLVELWGKDKVAK